MLARFVGGCLGVVCLAAITAPVTAPTEQVCLYEVGQRADTVFVGFLRAADCPPLDPQDATQHAALVHSQLVAPCPHDWRVIIVPGLPAPMHQAPPQERCWPTRTEQP